MSGDGNKNPAETSCLNYARRSPWPMINILRSNQVKAAQKGIPTGLVYQQNDERLSKVGSEVLQVMLVTVICYLSFDILSLDRICLSIEIGRTCQL